MAFFMDPGAMFLGCLGPSEQKFLVTLIETAAKSGYTRFVEPCAGTFAMANLAVQNGFKPEQIETSDVNMMSTVLGYAITGQSLEPLEIHAQGFSDEELLDPATALYAQLYLRTSKNAGNDYFYQILTDLRLRREEHIESINRQIEVIKNLLGGMSYRPLDMWEHLKEVLDDPHALVIANPPTYFSGYEKFYDTQGKMTWKEPPYELFDPETGHQQFYDLCMDAKALVICYQEKRVGEAVGYTIYARSGTRADLNAYITTNREEEATALANGKKIKRPAESKLQPLDCSMLPRDYVIQEDSKVQVIPIKSAEAQYYRELWTHNFVGSSATFNRALLIDGYVAGVFGISKMAADSVFVWYVMKVPHKTYRLGRLCYMLAQNRDFVDTLLDNIEQEKVTKMRTAMLTRYPENKEVRGIMKLVNRVEDKKNGYKLTYEAELVEGRTEQQDQERMKQANKAIRMKDKEKGDAKLHDMGYTDEQIAQLREPDFCGRIGFPDYMLTNNNANIRRLEGRIKSLQKTKSQGTQESENKFFKVKENVEAMRIQLFFKGKPEPEVRDILKSNGFRWAPSVGAWQRQLNNNGKYAVERVIRELEEMEAAE